MPGFIKTDRDEHLWSKAKSRAAEEGKAGQWPYITGIFKHMKGGSVNKKAHVMVFFNDELSKQAGVGKWVKNLWQTASGAKAGTSTAGINKLLAKQQKLKEAHHAIRKAMVELSGKPTAHKAMSLAARQDLLASSKLFRHNKRIEAAQAAHEKVLGEQKSARLKILGGTAALGAGGLITRKMLKKPTEVLEPEKQAAEKKKGINWKRLAAISALAGLGVGALKGVTQDAVAAAARKVLGRVKGLKKLSPAKIKTLGWGIGGGVASAGSGAAYGVSTGLGLKKDKQDKKK
jgi:hypothetical protein